MRRGHPGGPGRGTCPWRADGLAISLRQELRSPRAARIGSRLGACALCLAFLSPAVRHQVALCVVHEPTPFTALSMTQAPKRLTPGVPNVFTFEIHNQEGRTTSYRYQATAADGSGTTTLDARTVQVAPGATAQLSVPLTPAQAATTYLVTIQLMGRRESLHVAASS